MELGTFSIIAALFAATLLGGLPPIMRRWDQRGLHLFIAAAAGIFLGTVFLHLLPELAEASSHSHDGHASSLPWAVALAGFLGLFLLEKVWLRGNEERERVDPHAVVWVSTYISLFVHAFTAGLGLSALELKWLVLVPILWHKITESFSLTSVLQLAGMGRGKSLALIASFSLATPLGILLGERVLAQGDDHSDVLMGLACGTFLYVAACDLLPEVFHQLERRKPRLIALLAGIASTMLIPDGHGHGHGHEEAESSSFLSSWLLGSWEVFVAMAPYLLFGFLIAGLLSQWLKPQWLSRWLSKDDARSVGIASVVGAPLPLCSCSVIPVAASLRRSGASKGATSAFLVATPETGVDSVTVTYGLLDPIMAIARPIASVLSALVTGLGVNWLVKSGRDDAPHAGLGEAEPESCCSSQEDEQEGAESRAEQPLAEAASTSGGSSFLSRAMRYAFVDIFDDLAGALLLGVFLSGLISALVPESALSQGVLGGSSGLFVMLLIGIPIYVCAAASTPIAATLILKGLSPGAALVFLLAGPATNLAMLSVMTRYLGKRVVALHIAVLALVTLALGFALDQVYAFFEVTATAKLGPEHAEEGVTVGLISAGLLLVAIAATYARKLRSVSGESGGGDHGHSHDHGHTH